MNLFKNILLSLILSFYSQKTLAQSGAVKGDTIRFGVSTLQRPIITDTHYINYLVEGGKKTEYSREHFQMKQLTEYPGYAFSIRNTTASTFSETSGILDEHLNMIELKLRATTDSARLIWSRKSIVGWAQYEGKEVYLFDEKITEKATAQSANIPWFLTSLPLAYNRRFIVPAFNTYSRKIKWNTFFVIGNEEVVVKNKSYMCWKIDAGKVGPPKYRKTIWVDMVSNMIIQSELRNPEDKESTVFQMIITSNDD